jgi:hypothetical protein
MTIILNVEYASLLSDFQLICYFNGAKPHINFMQHLITLPSRSTSINLCYYEISISSQVSTPVEFPPLCDYLRTWTTISTEQTRSWHYISALYDHDVVIFWIPVRHTSLKQEPEGLCQIFQT